MCRESNCRDFNFNFNFWFSRALDSWFLPKGFKSQNGNKIVSITLVESTFTDAAPTGRQQLKPRTTFSRRTQISFENMIPGDSRQNNRTLGIRWIPGLTESTESASLTRTCIMGSKTWFYFSNQIFSSWRNEINTLLLKLLLKPQFDSKVGFLPQACKDLIQICINLS